MFLSRCPLRCPLEGASIGGKGGYWRGGCQYWGAQAYPPNLIIGGPAPARSYAHVSPKTVDRIDLVYFTKGTQLATYLPKHVSGWYQRVVVGSLVVLRRDMLS